MADVTAQEPERFTVAWYDVKIAEAKDLGPRYAWKVRGLEKMREAQVKREALEKALASPEQTDQTV